MKNSLKSVFAVRGSKNIKENVHNYYELYFLLDGQAEVFVENRTHRLKKSDIIIMKPNVLHRALSRKETKHELVAVYFDRQSIISKEIQARLDSQQGVISLPQAAAERVYGLIKFLLDETDADLFHNAFAKSILNEMLIVILRNENKTNQESAGVRFKNIVDFVKENSRGDITLVSVAEKFSISEAHLSRIFKKNTGFNFIQYVNYQRIIYAKKRLSSSDIPIGELAVLSGFEISTHFGRVFKQLIGVSPSEYRKIQKAEKTKKAEN
jgi:YesN/AraC family two-component response regulator